MTTPQGAWKRLVRPALLPIAVLALVIGNVFIAVAPARAADSDRQPCYYMPSGPQGQCVEVCQNTCYFCSCGGSCQETGGCEYPE